MKNIFLGSGSGQRRLSVCVLPVDGERLPRLLLFGHADDAGRRPAGAPHAAAPPRSPLSDHPARLPRRTPHLLAVVQHAPAAHRQNASAEGDGRD